MNDDRLLELLADRAVDSLDAADRHELDALLATDPSADDGSMEEAAVAAMLASLGEVEEMPSEVRQRTLGALEAGERPTTASTAAQAEPKLAIAGTPADAPLPRVKVLAWSGWIAAAACLVVAGITVVNSQNAQNAVTPAPAPIQLTLEQEREQFLAETADVQTVAWSDWDDPEIKGVTGEVAWSESAQTGFMTFTGLDANDPTEEQYQLWIIDERGMEQRISGAIFDSDSDTGEVIVRIDPRIDIRNAAAFAVTIEEPSGTWVSDMSRRVVIAALPTG